MARTDSWATPDWLWRQLHAEFRFDLDAAASAWSSRLNRWLGPGSPVAADALELETWPGRRIFLNPPYARNLLVRFLESAAREARRGAVVVLILPVRSDTDWWARIAVGEAREIRFVRRRVAFVPPPGHDVGAMLSNRPTYATAVVVLGPGPRPLGISAQISTLEGRPARRRDWESISKKGLPRNLQEL